jgi:hypothetical protein
MKIRYDLDPLLEGLGREIYLPYPQLLQIYTESEFPSHLHSCNTINRVPIRPGSMKQPAIDRTACSYTVFEYGKRVK